jgi:hypothetical protein
MDAENVIDLSKEDWHDEPECEFCGERKGGMDWNEGGGFYVCQDCNTPGPLIHTGS